MMNITLSTASEKPIYQQIYEQISAQIMKGELEKDAGLPPIRTMAKELRISVITVKKAWEQLERDGFIYTRVGKGCFVAPLMPGDLQSKQNEMAYEKLKKDIEYYQMLGISLEEMIELVRRCYRN